MTDPALLRAIEALLDPGPQAVDCAPRLFGHWPGGKSLDEWFRADAVSADDDQLRVSFNNGAHVLTVDHPGRWRAAATWLEVAHAQRVRLRTYQQGGQDLGAPATPLRTMDYRTEHGGVIDHHGQRMRWYPPDARPRLRHLGASRGPALELVLLCP